MATPQVQQSTEVPENVKELAHWAVEEYNKEHPNRPLEFNRVTDWLDRLVEGRIYFIILDVTDGGKRQICLANVWVKPWEQQFRHLLDFKFLTDLSLVRQSEVPGKYIEELAGWAVEEYNNTHDTNLQFKKVNYWELPIYVIGVIYTINLDVVAEESIKKCEARVWVFGNSKYLLEFKIPSGDA